MFSISSFTKKGPLGPSILTENVGISHSAPERMNILSCAFLLPSPVQRSQAVGTTHKGSFISGDTRPEPDFIVLAVGLLLNSHSFPDLTLGKCHMLHLQMGICSSRAASIPLQ